MAGIVKSTKKRILLGKMTKEVLVASNDLETELYFQDLLTVGGMMDQSLLSYEMGALPNLIKREATTVVALGAYSAGKVYGFNGDTKSIEELSFSRGSSATRVNEAGSIEVVAANIPRLDHVPETKSRRGILFEMASTNIRLNSGFTISGGGWIGGFTYVDTGWNRGVPLSKGAQATASQNIWYSGSDLVSGKTYTLSCYVKMSDGAIPVVGANAGNDFALILANISLSPSVVPMGSGIYRLSITATVPANSPNNTSGIYRTFGAGSSQKTVVATAFQIEEAGFATSYIPTTDSVVTRLADSMVSIRDLMGFPQATILIDGSLSEPALSPQSNLFVYKDASNSRMFYSNSQSQIASYNGNEVVPISRSTADYTQHGKLASSFGPENFRIAVNGAVAASANGQTFSSVANLNVLSSTGANTVRSLSIIPRALTDQELINITSSWV